MKMHPDWVLSITFGFMVLVALGLWQVHEGMDPIAAVAVGGVIASIVGITIVLSLPRWERMRPQQLEESRRGFPWRRFASGNGFAATLLGMSAVGGERKGTLELEAALIFGLGNAGAVVHWLIQRRVARRAARDPADPAGQTPGSA